MIPLPRWRDDPREYTRLYLIRYNAERRAKAKASQTCVDCKSPSKRTRCPECMALQAKYQ